MLCTDMVRRTTAEKRKKAIKPALKVEARIPSMRSSLAIPTEPDWDSL